jgi:hypothetical protein
VAYLPKVSQTPWQKVHQFVCKSLKTNPIWDTWESVYTLTPHSSKIHFNIILPFIDRSPKQPLPFRFSKFLHHSHFLCTCYVTQPLYPPWFNHPNNVREKEAPHCVVFSILLLLLISPFKISRPYSEWCQYWTHLTSSCVQHKSCATGRESESTKKGRFSQAHCSYWVLQNWIRELTDSVCKMEHL